MNRVRRHACVLACLIASFLAAFPSSPGVGAPAAAADAPGPAAPTPSAIEPALRDDTDLLVLPGARRPAPRPTVIAATRVNATSQAIAGVALDPAAMREALPALVRADVVATRPGPRKDAWPDRLIAWEVEIPLFNVAGRAWLQQRDDGVELTLVEGSFAPGTVRFRATPASDGRGSIATCELRIEVRTGNWIFRRVARHDPWAETAMSAATAWVLARAVSLRAEAARGSPPARPRGPITPPSAAALDGSGLGAPALALLRSNATLATVRRAPGGRVAWASVGVVVPGAPADVASRLATPERWQAFPGWTSVKRRATGAAGPGAPRPPTLIDVDDDVALVDFDAVWSVDVTRDVRATAIEGVTRGAALAWQVRPGDRAGSSLVMLSMHPRLDQAGFIERKLIAAEPLLEHAFAVAVAYVDAAAVADGFDNALTRR